MRPSLRWCPLRLPPSAFPAPPPKAASAPTALAPFAGALVSVGGSSLDYSGAHWTGKVTSSWSEPDPVSRLKELPVPTLIVSGEQDLPSFMLMAEAYAKAMPNARREIIQGVGHHVSLEAPEVFNELVRGFIAKAR